MKTKRSHQNDRRRITASERAAALFAGPKFTRATLAKAFEAHAAATLARHKSKARKGKKS